MAKQTRNPKDWKKIFAAAIALLLVFALTVSLLGSMLLY